MKKLFMALFVLVIGCQSLPPEAYFIDKNQIEGEINIDSSIKDKCSGTLFIIVRKGITPQPLAVKKVTNPKFPYKFSVSPAEVLSEERFKEFEGELILSARISKSGAVVPSEGDCESEAILVKSGDRNIKLTINRVIKQ